MTNGTHHALALNRSRHSSTRHRFANNLSCGGPSPQRHGIISIDLAGPALVPAWHRAMKHLTLAAACVIVTACGDRETSVIGPSPSTSPHGADFDQTFWNEFVHDAWERPNSLQPLRRLLAAPRVYLKTVDEDGHPIDALTLQTVEEAMGGVASLWAGGQFGLVGVERGTDTQEGRDGWLTVKWLDFDAGPFCGMAPVGVDGGWIAFNYRRSSCACDGSKIGARTARHELGHAFGYWHTGGRGDVMWWHGGCVDTMPSARERYHAIVAYESAVGGLERHQGSSTSHALVFSPPLGKPVVVVD